MRDPIDPLISSLAEGEPEALYLVWGDRALAEPAASRLASALADRAGCQVQVYRRPPDLGPILADLKTVSLFESAKVSVAIETALLADRAAAADLLDEVALADPPTTGDELAGDSRRAAGLLLQAIRLFGVSPEAAEPQSVLDQLPSWALQGGAAFRRARRNRPRGPKQVEEVKSRLAEFLVAALEAGLHGVAVSDAGDLADLLAGKLPPGHRLVLAESTVAADHPLVAELAARGALIDVGRVAATRDGFQGVGDLAAGLERETGAAISKDALAELERRTLYRSEGGRGSAADADSTARFAAEFRKLASAGGGRIEVDLVQKSVADRGEEDVWKILDAVGEGRAAEALSRIRRFLHSADDVVRARLSLFALLADFGKQVAAIRAMLDAGNAKPGERSYPRFKSRVAPSLQGVGGSANPLAGLHPFRLHRAYLAASGKSGERLRQIPWRVLETELRLKGASAAPDAALTGLVADLLGNR